jgi:hypothetical protein
MALMGTLAVDRNQRLKTIVSAVTTMVVPIMDAVR